MLRSKEIRPSLDRESNWTRAEPRSLLGRSRSRRLGNFGQRGKIDRTVLPACSALLAGAGVDGVSAAVPPGLCLRLWNSSSPSRARESDVGGIVAPGRLVVAIGEDDHQHREQDPGDGDADGDLVKTSPALVPKALEPPMPPKAPASPPPLPRWIRMMTIKTERQDDDHDVEKAEEDSPRLSALRNESSSRRLARGHVLPRPKNRQEVGRLEAGAADQGPVDIRGKPGARAALSGLTLPPYWTMTRAAVAAPNCWPSQLRMNAWADWACSGVAVRPVPIAQTGS